MVPRSTLGTSLDNSRTQQPVTLVIEPDGSLHLGLSPNSLVHSVQTEPADSAAAPRVLVRQNAKRWRSAQALQMIAEVTAEEADASSVARESTPSSMQEIAPLYLVIEAASHLISYLNNQAPLTPQR